VFREWIHRWSLCGGSSLTPWSLLHSDERTFSFHTADVGLKRVVSLYFISRMQWTELCQKQTTRSSQFPARDKFTPGLNYSKMSSFQPSSEVLPEGLNSVCGETGGKLYPARSRRGSSNTLYVRIYQPLCRWGWEAEGRERRGGANRCAERLFCSRGVTTPEMWLSIYRWQYSFTTLDTSLIPQV